MKIILRVWWVLICLFSGEIYAQNAPITSAGTVSTYGSTITVAITATNFTNIGSCNLKLAYNPEIVAATAVTTSSLLGGDVSSNLSVPGEIYLGWYNSPAMTLPDNSSIFFFDFTKVADGTSLLSWVDDGYSCQYTDGNFNNLNDIPQSSYYMNGIIGSGAGNIVENHGAAANLLKLVSHPNPFTDQVTFTFQIPEKGRVTLEILNMLGETVESVADNILNQGSHSLTLSPNFTLTGIYIAMLTLKTNSKRIISTIKIIRK